MIARRSLRVAVYTRKSTEEGLEQDFNSLDAQREACEAFIASQKELGWKLVPQHYDDGGQSGGSMERPALRRLLNEIAAGHIDVVIVYKIDRLTRSLTDFSKIVEVFDRNDVSFVSVTQQFNTSTSMGRLTLNMLLSFAQFERQVTAERIRDKIAASRRKGMWMGGLVPLGYDAVDKKLVINTEEAKAIRWLFATYKETGSVRMVKKLADRKGIHSKIRSKAQDRQRGGVPLSRGIIYRMLQNPVYKGWVRHKEDVYPGQHEAIIDEPTFDRVQALLQNNATNRRSVSNVTQPHLLTGLLFDETGDRLSPTHASKQGRRYRYYISNRLMHGERKNGDGWRLPAGQLEAIVTDEIANLLRNVKRLLQILEIAGASVETVARIDRTASKIADRLLRDDPPNRRNILQKLTERCVLSRNEITLSIDCAVLSSLLDLDTKVADATNCAAFQIKVPVQLKRRGVENRLILQANDQANAVIDPALVNLITRAHSFMDYLASGKSSSITDLAKISGINAGEISRILPLAFLAPDIVQSILAGRQPVELTATSLTRLSYLPIDWKDQRTLLGFGR